MLLQEEAVQTLVNLGLTVLQAKVYIALARSGASTGRVTAKLAKVASQDVYRVLTELQEKGLVEKIISKPNKYRAIPVKEGLLMLLQRRKKQTEELNRAVFELSNSFLTINVPEDKRETGTFVLIPQGEPIENRLVGVWKTAQKSIDLMNDFQEGIVWYEKNFELNIKALNRGVKIRDLLSKTQKRYHITKTFSVLLERKPEFQVRYLDFPPPAKLMIKDRKEVFISTTREINSLNYPCLWSNNPIVVQIIQQWYDIMWEKSSREIPINAVKIPA